MPLYEYKCSRCHYKFEIVQKVGAAPPQNCPKCGGPLSKVISAPALQFRGQGWYITDYARKKSPDGEEKKAEKPPSEKKEPESKVPKPPAAG